MSDERLPGFNMASVQHSKLTIGKPGKCPGPRA